MRQEDINNWFTHHTPTPDQVFIYTQLRAKAKEFAELFNDSTPDSADKTAAIRSLRQTVMDMNLAVACNPPKEFPVIGEFADKQFTETSRISEVPNAH
jgi:hypothetical protein